MTTQGQFDSNFDSKIDSLVEKTARLTIQDKKRKRVEYNYVERSNKRKCVAAVDHPENEPEEVIVWLNNYIVCQ